MNDLHRLPYTRKVEMIKFCKKCQVETERNAKGDCRPCGMAATAAWNKANPERQKARSAAFRAAHPERVKATQAAYRIANPEKIKAATEAWRAANPERVKATQAAYRAEHAVRIKISMAAWWDANNMRIKGKRAAVYAANPERNNARSLAWKKANPEANRIHGHNRRASKRENGGVLSIGLSAKLFKLQRGKCACCGLPLGGSYHLDHVMPIALGGQNTDSNMQLLKQRCNQQKHASHPVAFMQSRGYLL